MLEWKNTVQELSPCRVLEGTKWCDKPEEFEHSTSCTSGYKPLHSKTHRVSSPPGLSSRTAHVCSLSKGVRLFWQERHDWMSHCRLLLPCVLGCLPSPSSSSHVRQDLNLHIWKMTLWPSKAWENLPSLICRRLESQQASIPCTGPISPFFSKISVFQSLSYPCWMLAAGSGDMIACSPPEA